MENYKIKVNNEDESKEIQELFFELGYGWCCGDIKKTRNSFASYIYCYKISKDMTFGNSDDSFYNHKNKEITLQHLKDLVVLKRNDVDDASFKDAFGDIWYVDSTSSYWIFENDIWREAEEPLFKLEPIKKDGEVKMKEYLEPSNSYSLIKAHRKEGNDWIEVPEGAEEYRANYKFYKSNGELFYSPEGGWTKSIMSEYKTIWNRNRISKVSGELAKAYLRCCETSWQRNPETPNTSIQDKLKFIEKWLNGEKIQYILGDISDKSKWHNFTEGAMQYIKRSDIKFREAPKYVTINGIEFKNVEKLMKYVKNNFDLEDGE